MEEDDFYGIYFGGVATPEAAKAANMKNDASTEAVIHNNGPTDALQSSSDPNDFIPTQSRKKFLKM